MSLPTLLLAEAVAEPDPDDTAGGAKGYRRERDEVSAPERGKVAANGGTDCLLSVREEPLNVMCNRPILDYPSTMVSKTITFFASQTRGLGGRILSGLWAA